MKVLHRLYRKYVAKSFLVVLLLFTFTGCMRTPTTGNSSLRTANEAFYQTLESLQGKKLAGQTIFPEMPSALLAGQPVSIEVASCTKSEMRIPIYVGEKVFRTLILERTATGFFLKHEIKKENGQTHEINLYGGQTKGNGTAFMQFFPADTYTKNLLSLSAPSIWTLAFSSDYSTFSYLVEKDGKLEMQIDFNVNDYLATTANKTEQRSKR
ncbi:hypothetical protein HUW51_10385 [Adhaeribacter swui]|uniref:Lipoprotein n=1 Tax=Adhaeribacter swui TaxID=2086471 RepID=A0A7G7G7I0_9BACT|nr:hypothetical protein [Adhaeribacter swui]QNF33114.1 hypothetical protein HUW51_10385 [Adhaeribacter swui]